jgi:hypothetical protein
MAFEQNPYAVKITLVADASSAISNFSATQAGTYVPLQTQFTFVKMATAPAVNYNSSGNVATAVSALTDRPIGILQNQPRVYFQAGSTAGNVLVEGVSEAEVTVSGVTKVVAGATFNAGSPITTDTSGRAIAIVAGSTAGTAAYILGTALTSATAVGDIVTVAISCSAASRGA